MDDKKFTFVPFVMETSGALGKAAKKFIRKLREKTNERLCSRIAQPQRTEVDPLARMISLELQRSNGAMIIERETVTESLMIKEMARVEMFAEKKRTEAIERLHRNIKVPTSVKNTNCDDMKIALNKF